MNQEIQRIKVLESVLAERERKDNLLLGDQSHLLDELWNVMATEAHGEVAKEIYPEEYRHGNQTKLFIETIRACAVYFAWAEAILMRLDEESK